MKHGTPGCYKLGCRREECRAAATRQAKIYRLTTNRGAAPLRVPAEPTKRRIRALQWMGWTLAAVAHRAGFAHATSLSVIMKNERVHRDTARVIAEVYEALCMHRGPSDLARKRAITAGYAPPLAWRNIDDLQERPTGVRQ